MTSDWEVSLTSLDHLSPQLIWFGSEPVRPALTVTYGRTEAPPGPRLLFNDAYWSLLPMATAPLGVCSCLGCVSESPGGPQLDATLGLTEPVSSLAGPTSLPHEIPSRTGDANLKTMAPMTRGRGPFTQNPPPRPVKEDPACPTPTEACRRHVAQHLGWRLVVGLPEMIM